LLALISAYCAIKSLLYFHAASLGEKKDKKLASFVCVCFLLEKIEKEN